MRQTQTSSNPGDEANDLPALVEELNKLRRLRTTPGGMKPVRPAGERGGSRPSGCLPDTGKSVK